MTIPGTSFAGKVALVTGAGSGIGRATALAFAAAGANVAVADVDAAGGEETVRRIRAAGGEAAFFRTDVSRSAEVRAMVDGTLDRFGRLDCAFNNAGTEGATRIATHDYPEDVWDRVIDVNLKGTFLCLKYEAPAMLETGGAIVNASSVAGLIGVTSAAYTASKHGILGLTKRAALDYAKHGLRVNAVCPASVATPMIERIFGQPIDRNAPAGRIGPMGRLGEPEEIAAAVLYLCSDAAAFITGVALPIDGGVLAE
jgi:NAD(P)-dependent dehydrogenase (short-subunit alcohol dehydrogenase family)